MTMDRFLCPVCGQKLTDEGKTLRCPYRHAFDKSRRGYVNLLLSSSRGRHGDDKLMVRSRTAFLDKGYYAPLADRLTGICVRLDPEVLIDAGCGEGYYTSRIAEALPGCAVLGLDISKDAVDACAARCRGAHLAVASTSAMPVADGCADAVLNVFSPLFPEEFRRVLKPGGRLIRAVPLERHLHELRAAVYDEPYDNPPPEIPVPGFRLESSEELRYGFLLESNDDVLSLFRMTPYFYKTGRADQEKLEKLEKLRVSAEFGILTYVRE